MISSTQCLFFRLLRQNYGNRCFQLVNLFIANYKLCLRPDFHKAEKFTGRINSKVFDALDECEIGR
jgi:hypothetical protein